MKLNDPNADKNVAALTLPAGKSELFEWDDDLPGFGIRLRDGGSKSWIIQYRVGRKQRRKTIGSVAAMNAATARKAAKKDLARVELGVDPQAVKIEQRAKSADTYDALRAQFLARKEKRLKPSSYQQVVTHLTAHWAIFKGVSIHEIKKRTIADRLRKLAEERGPYAANRARTTLSSFFGWAIGEGVVDVNPVLGTHLQADEISRDRVLDDEELVDIWDACDDADYGRIIRLLLLTAARRDEVGAMLKAELNLPARTWHIGQERTKNSEPLDLPLSDLALSILEQAMAQEGRESRLVVFGYGARAKGAPDRGYSGWSAAKRDLDEKINLAREAAGRGPIDPWRVHDLRRTAATRMADLGVLPHVIEAVLNHISGHKAGVAGVYNRASYGPEKRQALDMWAAHVEALIAGQASNVVTMKRA
jgi:integrase